MIYTDDPLADFDCYDRMQSKAEKKLPVCECCGEPLYYSYFTDINGMDAICEDCLTERYRKDGLHRMKVLVACEESQAVTCELRKLGHEAYSCDIIECSGGHPEWHIMQDVLPLLNGCCSFATIDGTMHNIPGRWDMIIAFPPCTHLAVSGAAHFEKKREDGRQRCGIDFFGRFLNADCDKVAIENPVGIISGSYIPKWFPDLAEKYGLPRKPTQVIHPWMFGDNYSKSTCLWLKGLNPLIPFVTEQPELEWKEWTDKKTGRKKRQPLWFYEALVNSKTPGERAKIRSKTFPGIAKAMAEQWAGAFVKLH